MIFSEKFREVAREEMNKAIMRNLDSALIFKYIDGIEQENKQLKNDNAVMKAGLIQVSDKQRDLYKSVIEEVREYIYNHELVHERVYVLKGEDVLEILDKAKEKQNENN